MKVQAIIFDMDGVLVDTEPLFRNKVYEFYKRFNKNISLKEINKLAGSSHEKAMELMKNWFNEKMTEEEFEIFYNQNTKPLIYSYADIINPYIRYILPKLKNMGLQLAIASSSPIEHINKFITECNVDEYFDVTVTGRDFARSKPDPQIYLNTAEKLKVDPKECIVLEDSTYGIEAAKKAGMYVLAHRDDRFCFNQDKADEIFSDFFEAFLRIKEIKDGK